MLEQALAAKQAVFAVVAIIGSTEQGACDPLTDILDLRSDFEKQGLSFVVHCDGAWGGYFASMIRDPLFGGAPKGQAAYVPTLALSPYTEKQLRAYKDADSITIDPHKYEGARHTFLPLTLTDPDTAPILLAVFVTAMVGCATWSPGLVPLSSVPQTKEM